MWSLVFVFSLAISWANAQNGRGPQQTEHMGRGWDIRLAVPGEPGNDYPTLGAIPRTTFSCAGREPGYYADLETNCQVFRVCTVGSTYGFQSFLCPNGTLFNQAVFVCDWWMNVNCQKSEQYFNNNNEKFGNLKLGPQLMKDIKKMLTHPMRNPYDKNAMKSNQIVMQDYKPPSGQLFPNGALFSGPERAPNNVLMPAKLINANNFNDYSFSASTPEPRYLPGPQNNLVISNQKESDIFQRQRLSGQYNQGNRIQTPNTQSGNLISNGHTGQLMQNIAENNGLLQSIRPTQFTNNAQKLSQNTPNSQRLQASPQRSQYSNSKSLSQLNDNQQAINTPHKQNTNNYQNSQPTIHSTPTSNLPRFSSTINPATGKELKQNLVSTIKEVLSTAATKATTYIGKLPFGSKVGAPKPRLTIKTWIVKSTKAPAKSARLISPTPYTYAKPTPASKERIEINPTPYVYDRPTALSQTENTVSTESISESDESYMYTKPTSLPKLITTTTASTANLLSGRLDILPSSQPQITRVYLTPPTFSTSRIYLPPPQNPPPLSRQYLPANIIQPPTYNMNAQLRATTTPTPLTLSTFPSVNKSQPAPVTMPPLKTSNNLTFTDILTKAKLDMTVNDIVKDTNSILRTASPPQYNRYSSEFNYVDYVESDFSPTKTTTDSGENLTSRSPFQPTTAPLKNARLIATPSPMLQPPKQSTLQPQSNQLSNQPFYKESSLPNTIERTVSIKITIPERIAAYLFRNQSENDFDKLEILNTGSSNYLVLSNNLLTKDMGFNFIPIAKLNGNNSPNISNSQALVYSFLADSINVAKEYNNIAQQELSKSTPAPTAQQFQNLNNEQLSQISNQVSQLTSSQYSGSTPTNGQYQNNNIATQGNNIANPSTQSGQPNTYTEQNQARQVSSYNTNPSQQAQGLYSIQNTNSNPNNQLNQNSIYSGQLYQWAVPDVTEKIYNSQSTENLGNNNVQTQQRTSGQLINVNQQSSPTFEVVKAEAVPLYSVNEQFEPISTPTPFNSQENIRSILNNGNGISAQFQDKIVGTISHPFEEDKVVRYKKDQSYLLYTKLDDNSSNQNIPSNSQNTEQQNTKANEENRSDQVTYQLVPSISFDIEDEKEQQDILKTFRIDEFGAPRELFTTNNDITNVPENKNERKDILSEVSKENASSNKMEQYKINTLYEGPSSYSAPQSSVGSLEARQIPQNNYNSRLEDLDEVNNNDEGYPKERPARQFTF